MNDAFSATPTSTMRLDGPSDWPLPPWSTRDPWGAADEAIVPVRIETLRGFDVEGEMLGFDTRRQSLIFRFDEAGGALRVHFQRFRKLTLLTPLSRDEAGTDARLAFASHLRKFKLALTGDNKIGGRTAGHVENRAGLFLFTPDEEERDLQRAFVPACAYTRCVLGPSVEEDAALRWFSQPDTLWAAIEASQGRRKVIAIGEAIYNLGVISARQLSVALESQGEARKTPLGEMLVAEGLLARSDLRTALGHKMGYPLVNLSEFPLDAKALGLIPLDTAFTCNALPLMLRDQTLVVAVDNLACVAQLAAMQHLTGVKVMPVLARQSHIEAALIRAHREFGGSVWNVTQQAWGHTSPMAVL